MEYEEGAPFRGGERRRETCGSMYMYVHRSRGPLTRPAIPADRRVTGLASICLAKVAL